jgi:hypothetical protein
MRQKEHPGSTRALFGKRVFDGPGKETVPAPQASCSGLGDKVLRFHSRMNRYSFVMFLTQ